MLVKISDIEKKISKFKQNTNNETKSKIVKDILKKYNVWTQKIPKNFNNINLDINSRVKHIHQSVLLYDDIDDLDEIRQNRNKINFNEIKKTNSEIKVIKEIEPTPLEKNLKYFKNMNEKLKEMKNKKREIELEDGKSLKNISLNMNKIAKFRIKFNNEKEKKMRPVSASTNYESKLFEFKKYKTSRNIIKNNQWSLKSSKEEKKIKLEKNKSTSDFTRMINYNKKIEENRKRGNLERLNNIYRLKINRALKVFTPVRHLKVMKEIQVEDVNMKKNINNINDQITKRVKERCEGFYFKKQYYKYLLKNHSNRLNEIKSELIKNFDNKNGVKSLLSTRNYSSKNIFKQKLDVEKLPVKEKNKPKKENYKNILELIKNSLDIEPINAYINDKITNRNKKNIKEDEKKYFSKYEIINNKFREINEGKDDISDIENNTNKMFRTKDLISELSKNSLSKNI